MFIFYVNAFVDDVNISSLNMFKHLDFLQEVKIRSKQFPSYQECVDVTLTLIDDIITELKEKEQDFTFFCDQNPDFIDDEVEEFNSIPGIGILEKWSNKELTRFYVIDQSQKDESKVFLTKLIISIFSVDNNEPY